MGSDNIHHRKKQGGLTRKSRQVREYKNSILIVCEGEKTEPNYFKSFPVSNIKVKAIGIGMSTISLVAEAIKKWEAFLAEGFFFEHLWCVFDRDDFPQKVYNEAFEKIVHEERKINKKLKRKEGMKLKIDIAYTNEAFELWYLLHYDYIDSALDRSQYKGMLSTRMDKKYKKNDPKMYQFLQELSESTGV